MQGLRKRLGVARIYLHGTVSGEGGIPSAKTDMLTGAIWLKARDTLNRICDLAAELGASSKPLFGFSDFLTV